MHRALPATLALTLLLAGCVTSGGGEMTAKEAQGKADGAARAWHGDAVFVGIGTYEGNATPEMRRGLGNVTLAADAVLGDGRAPQWVATYASSSAKHEAAIVVYGNGTTAIVEDHGLPGNDTLKAAGAWSIDSPRAVEIARGDANFSDIAGAPGAAIVEGVGGSDGGNVTWFLGAFAGTRFAGVLVDANTGERHALPSFGGFPAAFGTPGAPGSAPKSYNFQGQLDATRPTASHPFDVREGAQTLQVSFQSSGTLPTDQVTYELRDAHDAVLQPKNGGGAPGFPGGRPNDVFDATGPGSYKLVATLGSSAPPAPAVGGSYNAVVLVA
ncbi:MAG: hypothetical protein LC624_05735 [Halobacteriales archaeon]|nr:hypothetical protein [Halobacteriales archaeon]